MLKSYNIKGHYICSKNIGSDMFTLFINVYKDMLYEYEYISLSETDVVLDQDAIYEAISILENSDINKIGNVSIDLHLYFDKYNILPIRQWVPKPVILGDYICGATGFQFIVFRKHFLFDFIYNINNKLLCSQIALGESRFYGISDSNLCKYICMKNMLWIRTKNTKLDHIGWKLYLNPNNTYVNEKNTLLKNKDLRYNIDINKFYITLI